MADRRLGHLVAEELLPRKPIRRVPLVTWHRDGAFMTPFLCQRQIPGLQCSGYMLASIELTDFVCGYSAFSAKLTSYAPPVLLACWANAWYPFSLVKYWASFNASGGRRMAAKNRLRSTSAPDRRALMNAMKFPVTASTAVSSGASCGTRGLFESLPDVWTAWQWCSTTLQPRSPSHAANTMHPSTGPARTGNALSWGCPRFFYSRGFAWRYWRLSPACWPLGSTFTHTRPPHNTASEA